MFMVTVITVGTKLLVVQLHLVPGVSSVIWTRTEGGMRTDCFSLFPSMLAVPDLAMISFLDAALSILSVLFARECLVAFARFLVVSLQPFPACDSVCYLRVHFASEK